MTTRVLPPTEWTRLRGHPVLGGYDLPSAGSAEFIVSEDDHEIVGVWALVTVLHLEPVWIKPEERGGMVAIRMWKLMQERIKQAGASIAWAFADHEEIGGYLTRLGLRETPYRVYQFGEPPCHRSS